MALYRDLTEDDARKIRNDIISLGREAIKYEELGGAESMVFQLICKQRELKNLLEKWEEWQKIKNCDLSDLI